METGSFSTINRCVINRNTTSNGSSSKQKAFRISAPIGQQVKPTFQSTYSKKSMEEANTTGMRYRFDGTQPASTLSTQIKFVPKTYEKAASLIDDIEASTSTVPKSLYDKLLKEKSVLERKVEQDIKQKDEKIKTLEDHVRELRRQLRTADEEKARLLQENQELKTREEIKIKKPARSSMPRMADIPRKTTATRRNITPLEDPFEETKENDKPEDMDEGEWESMKLAIQLQREDRIRGQDDGMRERARMLYFLNDVHLMRAIEASNSPGGGFDVNQSFNANNINPDAMTYEQLLQLGDKIGHVSKGLTPEQIKSIPKSRFRKVIGRANEEKQCSICFCEYEDGENLRKLKCKHDFHSKCIKTWLKDQKTCPVCKVEAA